MAGIEADQRELITQLDALYRDLVQYRDLVLELDKAKRPRVQQVEAFEKLRVNLQRRYGYLSTVIEKYGGQAVVFLSGREYDAFNSIFSLTQLRREAFLALIDSAITVVNKAIGKLQWPTLPETAQVQAPEDSAEMANYLFDKMQFHPKVLEASETLFKTKHYAPAIFAAFRAVENFVKKKSRLSTYGTDLMSKVFNAENPVIKLKTTSDQNEQEGFKFLFMGAMLGIRNPKAHVNVVQRDPYRTLEYLGFASMLIRRAEEGVVKRARKKQPKSPKSSS